MSAALNLAGIHRQPTEEFSFAEIEEQRVELLPSRTLLSVIDDVLGAAAENGGVIGGDLLPSGPGDAADAAAL